jgi:hypothetical protein
MSEEDTFILCIRKEDSKWAIVTEGSTLTNCCECDEPVWISPASVTVMLERECKPLCIHCAVDKPKPKGIKAPSTEQLKEIIKELKKDLENENPTNRFPGGTT